MNVPKTIRQIYREETGKDAEISSPLEGFELAVYVEAPSKDYIDWLERRASRTGGSANTSTNTQSPTCCCESMQYYGDRWLMLRVDDDCPQHGKHVGHL